MSVRCPIERLDSRVVASAADTSRKFITPHLHQLIHVRKVAVDGKLSWSIEMDEKGLLPVKGIVSDPLGLSSMMKSGGRSWWLSLI